MKILLAEDSRTQAALMKMHLERKGHTVVIADNGLEAIKKAYREAPDLIVSDVVMPRLNGYQVCRLLHDDRKTAGIPILLLTSLDQRQDKFWGLKSGADRFITKGGDTTQLVEEIHAFALECSAALGAAAGGAGDEEACRTDLDEDVMERVIQLLDRNLFESTVATEMQNLVNTLEDCRATTRGVLEILSKVIDFHVGAIYVSGEESQMLILHVNKAVDQRFLGAVSERVSREAGGAAAIAPESVQIVDPLGLLGRGGPLPDAPESVLPARLATKGQPYGALVLAAAEENAFPGRVEETFKMIARQAAIVIDYARLYECTKRLSVTDSLTKLHNYRYFQDHLRQEFARSERNRGMLSLLLLDIDHFKRFNDAYGHQQGDVVLKELAGVMRGQVRAHDIVSRYGGEEFAVIMPDTPGDTAAKAAERLRAAVEKHPVPGPSGPLSVNVSIGVASLPNAEIRDPAGLITAADRALYRAKEGGRNRVVRSGEDRGDYGLPTP